MANAVAPLKSMLEDILRRISAIEAHVGVVPPPSAGAAAAPEEEEEEEPESVTEFGSAVLAAVDTFANLGKDLAGDVEKITAIFVEAFRSNRDFLLLAARCKKPAADQLPGTLAALRDAMKRFNELRVGRDADNHYKGVKEAFAALNWVVMEAPTLPAPFVEAQRDAAEFWLNKVRAEFRSKDKRHVDWCNAARDSLNALYNFIKAHAKTGVAWNPRGQDAAAYLARKAGKSAAGGAGGGGGGGGAGGAAAATAAVPATAAVSPIPAPSPSAAAAGGGGGGGGGGGAAAEAPRLSAVFSQLQSIDQSSGRTAGLRHVTKDMKSKSTGGVVASSPSTSSPTPAPVMMSPTPAPTKPPRTELVDTRWFVENHVKPGDVITVSDATVKHEVVIYGCVGVTIVFTTKVKTMSINSCKRCQIVFEGAVSSCELVNCQRIKVQTKGICPSFGVDKTDGCVVYLAHESRGSQIYTSKSSELNVSFPTSADPEADWIEVPIPEQFVSVVRPEGTLDTRVSELYSH